MRILREHLLLCTLITLLSGNVANKSPSYDGTLTQNENFLQNEESNYRLPTDVKPISYDIKLIPKLKDDFTFTGYANIETVVERTTNSVTLHVGNIEIKAVNIITYTNFLQLPTSYDNITEKYTITLPKTVKNGSRMVLSFTWNGVLSDNLIGFYRSSYFDEKGEIKWLAATQLQTIHARHVFPCFDEPSFKAKFTIRIARDDNYISLSNMNISTSGPLKPGSKTWDVFKESVPMSTYLVAFIVAEFSNLGEDEFKVWSKQSIIEQAKYALEFGPKALELYGKKFNENYTLEKMDMVAVPDFAAGATENMGLVMYRESRMLYDEKESSAIAQQKVASTIAHELSHMWFGNMVTPEWWSYLWLSEGFARYFEYFGTAEIETNWKMEEQFVVDQHQSALIADSLESSLSMTREVSNKLQIAGIGDTITYNKGASIIRMMSLLFGTDIFENTLRNYIQNNKETGLGNPDALWAAMKTETDKEGIDPSLKINIKTVMNTWTTKPGYPVVSIAINDINGVLNISQERFLVRNLDGTPIDTIWSVPLTFTTQKDKDFNNMIPKYWLSTKKSTADFNIKANEWVIFNVQSSGFYRVNYNDRGWKNIFDTLNHKNLDDINVLNRAAIVDDLLNLARAGYQHYDMILNGLLYLKRETSYLPFKAAFNGFEYLNKRFTGYAEHYLFKRYVLSLIDNIQVQLGYEASENDDWLTILLRQEVNNWFCNFDDNECIRIFMDKFIQWKANANARIDPNERAIAYCVAIRHGTSDDWEFLWKEYTSSSNAADQIVILNALGCSQNTTILEKYLNYAITNYEENWIRKQDSTTVFAAIYNSGLLGAEYVLDFVEKYHKKMEEYYGEQNTIATILDEASQRLSTVESVDKFESLINNHKVDFTLIEKSLNFSLKIAKYELGWYNSFSTSIIQWLQTYENEAHRLPTSIIPKKYIISITPHLESDFTFDGKVTIEADVMEPINQIILHSSKIEHHNVTVMLDDNQEELKNIKTKIIDRYDFYVIYLPEDELTTAKKLTINIEYTSNLNVTDLRGFYKSSYVNETGDTRWLAASHLEPIGARKMFPCFDEPAMKANFTIQVKVLPGYKAISNMGLKAHDKTYDGYVEHTFFESVPMSTYLVALIVSDFNSQSEQVDGTELAVYARPNAINQTDYALSIMAELLRFFETTYKQNYQLPQLFMAALPDFSIGAMENWGLLTYKESNLLYDENQSPITNKQNIRNKIAHEISHQWFGNLVSPSWWNYLWLSEGFARYFEYHVPAIVSNDMTMESQFVVDQVHSAFSADSSKSTHSMNQDVTTPYEILSIFDTITYAKGASILRMIEKTYGNKVFNDALCDYLDKQKYSVATPDDLYASLQLKITDKGLNDSIKTILDTWTTQSGYPVINVNIKKNTIFIEQKRFFLKEDENNSDNTMWHIPITWASIENSSEYFDTTPKLWLTKNGQRVKKPSNSLLIFNTQQSGYYRVNYKTQWTELIDYLKNQNIETIHEINRAALIDDLMNLARADYVDYKTVISAIMYLEKENNYFPWRAFFNNLPYLNNRFAGRDIEGIYKKWLTLLIEQLYTRLGFEDLESDNDLTKILKIHTRKWACKLDIANCKFYAAKYFQQKQHSNSIPPNYRDVVYCTAIRLDKTNKNYKFLWEEYLNSNVVTDKLVILKSLACSENKDVLETLLRNAITENSGIRYQDSAKVFSNVYDASLIGVEVVIKVIKTYYDDMYQHFNDYTKIASMMSDLASRLSTNDLYNQYQTLLNELLIKEPKLKNSIDSYLATAIYEFDWYEKKAPVIFEALDNIFSSNTAYRLPKTLYPTLYNIHLTPYMEEGVFEGKVEIHMTVQESTTLIVLNSHKLNISDNIVVCRNGTKIEMLNYTEHIPQQLKIYLSSYIRTDEEITVEIHFNGTLNDDMIGFYRSSYFDNNGKHHWLATTQFAPTYARQAFPCFDEPAFKSKFTINIQRPINYNSRSNMPLKSETKYLTDNKFMVDTFDTTNVVMSTYLVAFVVSEFKPVDNFENATFNVWGRPDVAIYGKYAQNIGIKLLDELQNFTSIDYALPKLDLVGIPDFSMGAMENWGLITSREEGLFYSEKDPTSAEKYVIAVIAHELTHMWFGNLVTCDWWDYIWLNEGFAQYFEWFIADQVRPEYNIMDQFVVYELHPALLKDASISTHPMTNPVETPEEIADNFDDVTYGKSASVLRMIFNAFDEEAHILALRDYLKNANLTARPADLWKSFEPYVSIPIGNRNASVEEVMSTWTNQPGYPVVNATLTDSILTLSQERFLMNKSISGNEFYWIPIDIFVQSDVFSDVTLINHKIWLGPEIQRVHINSVNDWFIVNYKQTGFYRVNYDTSSWKKLIEKLNNKGFENINVLNRAQIIDDLFNLARANYVDYELLMSAMAYLKQETNHLPWKACFNGLSFIHGRFEQQTFQKDLNGYLLKLLSNMYDKVGFDDQDNDVFLDKLNREMILQWACKLNKAECIKKSVDLFAVWYKDNSAQIPHNARPAVYCTAIKEGSKDDWEFLWDQYLKTNFASEKKIIINALGCSKNETILQNYLGKIIEKHDPGNAVIRRQDISAVFTSVYSAGPIGVDATLNFLITNMEPLYEYFENWNKVADLYVNVASYISSADQYNALVNFIEQNITVYPPVTRIKLRSAITTAETNLYWYKNYGQKIRDWILKAESENDRPNSSIRIESQNIVFTTIVVLISYFLNYY